MANKTLTDNEDDKEIDFSPLYNFINTYKWLIIIFTVLSFTLATIYSSYFPKPIKYQASISVISPSLNSLLASRDVNVLSKLNELSQVNTNSSNLLDGEFASVNLFITFLNKTNSPTFQFDVFKNENYSQILNPKNNAISDWDLFNGFASSLKIMPKIIPAIGKKTNTYEYELPTVITLIGSNPELMIDFLNNLIFSANEVTTSEYLNDMRFIISSRIFDIQVNIDALKIQAKQARLSEIESLKDAAQIANSLKIFDNNFSHTTIEDISSGSTTIKPSIEAPNWYMYGEKALLARIKILENRNNDYPFVQELIQLEKQLFSLQEIDKSMRVEKTIQAMQLNKAGTAQRLKETNFLTLYFNIICSISGFLMSILIALFLSIMHSGKKQ